MKGLVRNGDAACFRPACFQVVLGDERAEELFPFARIPSSFVPDAHVQHGSNLMSDAAELLGIHDLSARGGDRRDTQRGQVVTPLSVFGDSGGAGVLQVAVTFASGQNKSHR